jgi:uncharacterized repeat protein (TIGR03803 family)
MQGFSLGRYALSVCAAELLAGCGGSGTPLSPSLGRLTAELTRPGVAYKVLYDFKGGSGDGEYPYAGLVKVKDTLYGTTSKGGASSNGTVFSITPSGTEIVLHSLGGAGDGAIPYAGLLNVNGMLYGTTAGGGASGSGTAFSITTSGAETVLYSFNGREDGKEPSAGLLNVKGTLYGTAEVGGASGCGVRGCGTVFSLSP